jgi:hypothetical protein
MSKKVKLSRRDFLRMSGLAGGALALAGLPTIRRASAAPRRQAEGTINVLTVGDPWDLALQNVTEQFTEATLKIPIEVSNLPDSLIMRTFPGQVTINCMVTLGRYENLSPRLFRVEVDYSQIKKNIGIFVKLRRTFPFSVEIGGLMLFVVKIIGMWF